MNIEQSIWENMNKESREQVKYLLSLIAKAESYITHEAGMSVEQKAKCDPRNELRSALSLNK